MGQLGGERMSIILTKTLFEEDEESVWEVTVAYFNGNGVLIPFSYTFESTETNDNMETFILNDLTDKNYTNLEPITWGE